MSPLLTAALTAGAFLIALLATRWFAAARPRRGLAVHPKASSGPAIPIGGLGLLAGALPAWGFIFDQGGAFQWSSRLALGVGVLAIVSWWHDRVGVPWYVRLLAQFLAVAWTVLPFIPHLIIIPHAYDFALLPYAHAFVVAAGILWLGFMGASAVVDRVDGLVASHAIVIAGGCALGLWWLRAHPTDIALALTLGAASAGFLVWNRPSAYVLIGEVGRVPLAFLLGFLLVRLAAGGAWGAALALPAAAFAEAALALWRRWQAGLLEPVSQRAARKVGGAKVLRLAVLAQASILGAVLIGLSLGGVLGHALTLAVALAIVAVLLVALERLATREGPA